MFNFHVTEICRKTNMFVTVIFNNRDGFNDFLLLVFGAAMFSSESRDVCT